MQEKKFKKKDKAQSQTNEYKEQDKQIKENEISEERNEIKEENEIEEEEEDEKEKSNNYINNKEIIIIEKNKIPKEYDYDISESSSKKDEVKTINSYDNIPKDPGENFMLNSSQSGKWSHSFSYSDDCKSGNLKFL